MRGEYKASSQDMAMADRVCMVTGATSGIGAVAANSLARLGYKVIVVGRNREKCEATVNQIREKSCNSAVEFLTADLSSQADIRRLAERFHSRHQCLHILIN